MAVKYEGRADTPAAVSTFADQMHEASKATADPVEAMTMRVASEMMAVLPRHASTARDVDVLMRALPSICISLVETVAATAYQGDMGKAQEATAILLRRAVAGYDNRADAQRIHLQRQ